MPESRGKISIYYEKEKAGGNPKTMGNLLAESFLEILALQKETHKNSENRQK